MMKYNYAAYIHITLLAHSLFARCNGTAVHYYYPQRFIIRLAQGRKTRSLSDWWRFIMTNAAMQERSQADLPRLYMFHFQAFSHADVGNKSMNLLLDCRIVTEGKNHQKHILIAYYFVP